MTRGMHTQQQAGMAAAATTKKFYVGDKVRWSSQAAGSWKTKEGQIVEAAAPKVRFSGKHGYHGCNTRDHEAYIVAVAKKTPGKFGYYFPLVSKLQKV